MGAELFHSDERTDRPTDKHDGANNRFQNFSNAHKNTGRF